MNLLPNLDTLPSLTAIQDRWIRTVRACRTGHVRRVRRAASAVARRDLTAWGFSNNQQADIMHQAEEMLVLEEMAA